MEFVLSTDELNRYGYRVLTSGIDLSEFEKNPIMLWNHRRGENRPIGKWTKLRKEKGRLIGTPVFSESDPVAQEVAAKVNEGVISATSIGFAVLEYSDDPEHIVKGQRRATVTKSKLWEVSFTDIPANAGAVKLTATVEEQNVPLIESKQKPNMKNIALSLGLQEDATEGQIVEMIETNKKVLGNSKQHVAALVALGLANGHVTEENKEKYQKLANAEYDTVFELFSKPVAKQGGEEPKDNAPAPINATDILQNNATVNDPNDRENWDFDKWSKEDPDGLLAMKKKDLEAYKALVMKSKK